MFVHSRAVPTNNSLVYAPRFYVQFTFASYLGAFRCEP